MRSKYFTHELSFNTAETTLRPPDGELWIVRAAIEVGGAATLQITDGTTEVDWRTSSADSERAVGITRDWYLRVAGQAQNNPNGWLLTLELAGRS